MATNRDSSGWIPAVAPPDAGAPKGRIPIGVALRSTFAKGYGWPDLRADMMAGMVVGIIALPLSMALAIAVGVPPQHGLYLELGVQERVEARQKARIEEALRKPERACRPSGIAGRCRCHIADQLVRRHDMIDQAKRQGFGSP